MWKYRKAGTSVLYGMRDKAIKEGERKREDEEMSELRR